MENPEMLLERSGDQGYCRFLARVDTLDPKSIPKPSFIADESEVPKKFRIIHGIDESLISMPWKFTSNEEFIKYGKTVCNYVGGSLRREDVQVINSDYASSMIK